MLKRLSYKNFHLLGAVSLLGLGSAALAADLPTDQALQAMFDQKQYRSCLQQTARVLALQGPATAAYDPFVLQMRRGECFLHLGDYGTAGYAFSEALSAAPSPQEAEQARAMVVLVKASKGGVYRPRGTSSGGMDIVSAEARKGAMKACFADQFAMQTAEIQAAQTTTSLPPIIAFVPEAQNLHALEMAGTGADEQTRPALLAIGEQARRVITTALKTLNTQMDGIQARANQLYASGASTIIAGNGARYFVGDTRAGLSPEDRDALRQMLPYLADIGKVSTRGKEVAQSVGATGAAWDPVIAETKRTSERAQSVLAAE